MHAFYITNMVDLNKYLAKFKSRTRMFDFPDEYIFQDKEMCKYFCYWLKYKLLNKYYYSKNAYA